LRDYRFNGLDSLIKVGKSSVRLIAIANNISTHLRQAMLTTKEKYPEPFNWAAFTLVGEN
jgi:hypothetical protein